jgi:hypothetical protein
MRWFWIPLAVGLACAIGFAIIARWPWLLGHA